MVVSRPLWSFAGCFLKVKFLPLTGASVIEEMSHLETVPFSPLVRLPLHVSFPVESRLSRMPERYQRSRAVKMSTANTVPGM